MFSKFRLLLASLFVLAVLSFLIIFTQIDLVILILLIVVLFILLFWAILINDDYSQTNEDVNLVKESDIDDLLSSISVPTVILDNNLNVLNSNHAYQQLFVDHSEHLKNVDHDLKSQLRQALYASGSTRFTVYYKNREYLMISSRFKQNTQVSTLLMFNDVSAFMDAQKAQKRFIADASHELKTPITSIKGLSELLLTRDVDKETQHEFINQINKESNRLQNIVNDLLELSKLSSNRVILNYSSFDIADLVKDVYHSLKQHIIAKELTFIYDFNSIIVYLDYDKIHQVISNLLINAINYSDKGAITLKIMAHKNTLTINLIDQGIGIADKHISHLFDRFYRIDASRSRIVGGSGLGLSIVKEIIDAHHGSIRIDSQVNIGTSITIELPLQLTNS